MYTQIKDLQQKFPLISDVRALGLFMGIELRKENGERAVEEAEKMMYLALENGMNFKVTMGNILTLTPALTISKEEIEDAASILDQCFSALK